MIDLPEALIGNIRVNYVAKNADLIYYKKELHIKKEVLVNPETRDEAWLITILFSLLMTWSYTKPFSKTL